MARDNYVKLDNLNNRKDDINGYSEDIINENKDEIDLVKNIKIIEIELIDILFLLEKIVDERFTRRC